MKIFPIVLSTIQIFVTKHAPIVTTFWSVTIIAKKLSIIDNMSIDRIRDFHVDHESGPIDLSAYVIILANSSNSLVLHGESIGDNQNSIVFDLDSVEIKFCPLALFS